MVWALVGWGRWWQRRSGTQSRTGMVAECLWAEKSPWGMVPDRRSDSGSRGVGCRRSEPDREGALIGGRPSGIVEVGVMIMLWRCWSVVVLGLILVSGAIRQCSADRGA
jgi:hypothetical protein